MVSGVKLVKCVYCRELKVRTECARFHVGTVGWHWICSRHWSLNISR